MWDAKRDLPVPVSPVMTMGPESLARRGSDARNRLMAGLPPMISSGIMRQSAIGQAEGGSQTERGGSGRDLADYWVMLLG